MTDPSYFIKLLSDDEIRAGSVYDITNSTIDITQYNKFGTDNHNIQCGTCGNFKHRCPSHYGTLELSYPYLLPIMSELGSNIIHIICIYCFKILCPDEELELIVNNEPPEDRIQRIKEYVKKKYDQDKHIVCQNCMNTNYKLLLLDKCESMNIYTYSTMNSVKYLTPFYISVIFNNITQIEELGLNENLHPSKFYSNLVIILGNKIRQAVDIHSKGKSMLSTLTNIYTYLIKLAGKLREIYNMFGNEFATEDNLRTFIKVYRPLCDLLYIMSIGINEKKIDKSLFEKTLQNQLENYQSFISHFKGKEENIFMNGIIASRHECVGRSVLNGAPRSRIGEVKIPYVMLKRLSTVYPVYYENINFIYQLLEKETENRKNIVLVEFNKEAIKKVEVSKIPSLISKLSPGCKIHVSLMPGDFALVSRYPAVREESITAFNVVPQNSKAISFPLSVCDMKMADYDGDEVQIFINGSRSTEIECLLLNSVYSQLITHKDGNFAIWYSKDANYGLKKIPTQQKEKLLSLLPAGLVYKDDRTSVNVGVGVFEGVLDNMSFMKYIANYYGRLACINIMNQVILMSYDINKETGLTFGFEYNLPKPLRAELKKLMDKRYAEMLKFEATNSKTKDEVQLYDNSQLFHLEALELLIKHLNTTNFSIFNMKKFEIQLFKALVCIGQNTTQSGNRFQPKLNNNSRTICSFPRYYIDPKFYGYSTESYMEGKSPETEFFEQFESRDQAYEKGVGVAAQGYLAKKFNNFLGSVYANHNGAVILNNTIASLTYGSMSLNPRRKNIIELPSLEYDIDKYLSYLGITDQTHALVKEILTIREKILHLYEKYSKLTIFVNDSLRYEFNAGFYYNRLIEAWDSAKTGKLTDILPMIETLFSHIEIIYAPLGYELRDFILKDLIYLKYFLFEALILKGSTDQKLYDEIELQFMYSLIDGGEPIGIKASITMSEPLTQASLHAIHSHRSTVMKQEIDRSSGVDRFDELYGEGLPEHHSIILNIKDNTSEENYRTFINNAETFYYKDIWSSMKIFIANEFPKLMTEFYSSIDFTKSETSKYVIEAEWNINIIANYECDVMRLINKLKKIYLEILFIAPVVTFNSIVCYIYFRPHTSYQLIHNFCEFAYREHPDNIISGSILKNCIKSKNVPLSLINKNETSYCIESNIIIHASDSKSIMKELTLAINSLLHDPNIDIGHCYSNNIDIEYLLYGVFEAQPRFYEESIYTASKLSETSGILNAHYKLATEVAFMTGVKQIAKPSHLRKNFNLDPLRKILFERSYDFIKSALYENTHHNMDDPDAAQIFNQYSKTGVGISKVLFKNLS